MNNKSVPEDKQEKSKRSKNNSSTKKSHNENEDENEKKKTDSSDKSYYSYHYSEEEEYYEEEEYSSGISWMESFIDVPKRKWFSHVPYSFMEDDFNLYGLNKLFPNYDLALDIILDSAPQKYIDLAQDEQSPLGIEVAQLYFLIHQRYLQSDPGLDSVRARYDRCIYGKCPREKCHEHPLLPIGKSSKLGISTCWAYCPCCQEIYFPQDTRMNNFDGAAFGSSLAPLFMSALHEYEDEQSSLTTDSSVN